MAKTFYKLSTLTFQAPKSHHNFTDLTGQVFHRLTVLGIAGYRGHLTDYFCRCSCDRIVKVLGSSLINGNTRSCGCLHSERTRARMYKHGQTSTSEYHIWAAMIGRCMRPSDAGYGRYGGRGIAVCDRWRDFSLFFEDLGPRPSPKHSLERLDNNGNYEPLNCKWATRLDQANNTRHNRHLRWNGRELTVAQWARELDVSYPVLRARLCYGWCDECTLTQPKKGHCSHRS